MSVSPKGTLLVKSPASLQVQLGGRGGGLRIGTHTADERREPAGRVVDIIGPVSSPYVVVQPERGAKLHRLLGKDLYPQAQPSRPSRPSPQGGRDKGWRPRRSGGR